MEKEDKFLQELGADFKSVAYDIKSMSSKIQGIFSSQPTKETEKEDSPVLPIKTGKKVDENDIFHNVHLLDDDKNEEDYNKLRNAFIARRNIRADRVEKRREKRDKDSQDKELLEKVEDTQQSHKDIINEAIDGLNEENLIENEIEEVEVVEEVKAYQLERDYQIPSSDFIKEVDEVIDVDSEDIPKRIKTLQDVLDSFAIDAEVLDATVGPRVTLFKVNPAKGIKVEDITRIGQNIAMEMQAISLRIMAPVPGKSYVGIEVPNKKSANIGLKPFIDGDVWQEDFDIPLILGKNIAGNNIVMDLAKAPHLLIAGATGSGKSVCLNAMVLSLVYKFTPEKLRLILVDPKVVEFNLYNDLPHLVVPVVTDVAKVPMTLRWAVNEMEYRYKVLAKARVRNLKDFNNREQSEVEICDDDGKVIPDEFPHIVIIIDELADLMMVAQADVECYLARLAQKSRAVGIHTIIATQRPSVNVLTGVIKANYPTRISFKVPSLFDSRTILDAKGAETLLGQGDMFYKSATNFQLQRIQGPYISESEIENIVEASASQAAQKFNMDIFVEKEENGDEMDISDTDLEGQDLVALSIEIIQRDRKASTSYLQRRLKIGYNKAAGIMDELEERGIIGPQIGSSPREIF